MSIENFTGEYPYERQLVTGEIAWLNARLGAEIAEVRIVGLDERGPGQGQQAGHPSLEYEDPHDQHSLLVWKELAVGKGLQQAEAEQLLAASPPYRESLEAAGWRLPDLVELRLLPAADEWRLLMRERYIGGDDGAMLLGSSSTPDYQKYLFVHRVIDTLYRYPKHLVNRWLVDGQEVTGLPHGIDLKPANLAAWEHRQLYLLDSFAPKLLDDAGNWRAYLPRLEARHGANDLLRMCATREGALLRFWQRALQDWSRADPQRQSSLNADFIEMLAISDIPEAELVFMKTELENGYPWLSGRTAQ